MFLNIVYDITCFALQHVCPKCGKAFRTSQFLRSHLSDCLKCPYCDGWFDKRHAERCKDNVLCDVCDRRLPVGHKCRGKKLVKGKQIWCAYCRRAITENEMYKHMPNIHGMKWSKYAYPECMPLVRDVFRCHTFLAIFTLSS